MTASIAYPFPIRPEFLAQVVLPRDMTKTEADRLCAFVMSLAAPNPAVLPPITKLECSKCKVDRLKAQCPNPAGCPVIGVAALAPASPHLTSQEPQNEP